MKKQLILIFTVLFVISFNLFSTDSTSDEKKDNDKFPGIFSLGFTQEMHADTVGKALKVNYGWSDFYMKTTGKAGLAFPIKFYTITTWLADYAELPFTAATGTDPIKLDTKNNFQMGLNNTFSFDNIISIDCNFEFKLGSCLATNLITGNSGDGVEIRLTPILNLSGLYDFGLSWSISNNFEFYLYPDKNYNFQFFDYEGSYNIAFDYFHFFAPSKIKGAIYAELYLWARSCNQKVLNEISESSEKSENQLENQLKNLDPAIGLTFDIYGFTPMVLFFMHMQGDITLNSLSDFDMWVGTKCGLGFTKDWFSINAVYYGTISTKSGSEWQNHIETYINFKLGL